MKAKYRIIELIPTCGKSVSVIQRRLLFWYVPKCEAGYIVGDYDTKEEVERALKPDNIDNY